MAESSRATSRGRGTRPPAGATEERTARRPSTSAEPSAPVATTVAVPDAVHDGHQHRHLDVPVLVPELHVHRLTVPAAAPRVPLPHVSTGNVLWLGGLAALAAVGAIGWPVAAVVAAGTYVAERRARHDVRQELADHEAVEAATSTRSSGRTG